MSNKLFPLERVTDIQVRIKLGHLGWACATTVVIPGQPTMEIAVLASRQEDAAAVCEFLTGSTMDLALVKRAMISGDPTK